MLLAQIPDPATLLTGTNIAIAAVVIGGILLYRKKDDIVAKIKGTSAPADEKAAAGSFIDTVKKGLFTSDIARSGASNLCRRMLPVADALPNKVAAAKLHAALRDAFVEFGDPTPVATEADDVVSS